MKNQVYTGTPTSRRQIACPSTVKAGDPLLVGKVPCIALDDYQSNIGGTTVLMGGSFTLTVVGQSTESPTTPSAINAGDALYATGTLDAATNVTYNLTIDKNSSNTPFGNLGPNDPTIPAGITSASATVFLHYGA